MRNGVVEVEGILTGDVQTHIVQTGILYPFLRQGVGERDVTQVDLSGRHAPEGGALRVDAVLVETEVWPAAIGIGLGNDASLCIIYILIDEHIVPHGRHVLGLHIAEALAAE